VQLIDQLVKNFYVGNLLFLGLTTDMLVKHLEQSMNQILGIPLLLVARRDCVIRLNERKQVLRVVFQSRKGLLSCLTDTFGSDLWDHCNQAFL
jgi:hypothetical protein